LGSKSGDEDKTEGQKEKEIRKKMEKFRSEKKYSKKKKV
jgi:hypothetical protein